MVNMSTYHNSSKEDGGIESEPDDDFVEDITVDDFDEED